MQDTLQGTLKTYLRGLLEYEFYREQTFHLKTEADHRTYILRPRLRLLQTTLNDLDDEIFIVGLDNWGDTWPKQWSENNSAKKNILDLVWIHYDRFVQTFGSDNNKIAERAAAPDHNKRVIHKSKECSYRILKLVTSTAETDKPYQEALKKYALLKYYYFHWLIIPTFNRGELYVDIDE